MIDYKHVVVDYPVSMVSRTTGGFIGALENVVGGSVTQDLYAQPEASGHITWAGLRTDQPDWSQIYIRPRQRIWFDFTQPPPNSIGLGLYIPTSVRETVYGRNAVVEVSLASVTAVMDDEKIPFVFTIPQSVEVRIAAQDRVGFSSLSGLPLVIAMGTVNRRMDSTWAEGTPRSKVVNDLLLSAGMERLHTLPSGALISEPWTIPSTRTPVADFIPGQNCYFKDGYTVSRNYYGVPNHVVVTSESNSLTPALQSVVSLDTVAPGHPASEAVTGRRVLITETGVRTVDQANLDLYARRKLESGLRETGIIDLEVHPIHGLNPGNVVNFAHLDEAPKKYLVTRKTTDLSAKTTKLRIQETL